MTIVRPFNTYGSAPEPARHHTDHHDSGVVAGDELKLGNLDPIRDLTFVTDTAQGFLAASKSSKTLGETVNLGVGFGVSVGDLVERIGKLVGKKLSVQQDPERVRPDGSEVDRLISNNEKMRSLTDWEPKVDLDAGLEATLDHIQKHPADYPLRGYVI